MDKITDRQKRYLLIITQEYIATGRPVGSSHLIDKYKLETSSATIRNEMAALEKCGFLEKAHTSSGRLPSAKGFTLYANEMKDSNVSKNIKEKLNTIFAKRIMDIDQVLEEAAEAVSEIAELTLVTNSNEGQELLKSIQFVPLNETNATIVLVSSSGKVESKLITTTNKIEMEDIRISIRILKDRLIDTPINSLAVKTEALDWDGDELDVLVYSDETFQAGVQLEARIIGAMKMIDDGETDTKLIAVHADDYRLEDIQSMDDLPKEWLKNVEEFFSTYKNWKRPDITSIAGFEGKEWAEAEYKECVELMDKYAKMDKKEFIAKMMKEHPEKYVI